MVDDDDDDDNGDGDNLNSEEPGKIEIRTYICALYPRALHIAAREIPVDYVSRC